MTRHVTTMTLEDAEHYTPQKRAEIIASYPAHEREARAKGIPTFGSGLVFPIVDEDISVEAFKLPPHFARIAALSIAAFFALVHVSRARDLGQDMGQVANASPEVRTWVRGLKDRNGAGCCDTADGYPAEAEWDTAGEHYKVRIDGAWYVVPDEAVITEPNKLGYAVVWVWHDFEGKLKIRFFIPGGGV